MFTIKSITIIPGEGKIQSLLSFEHEGKTLLAVSLVELEEPIDTETYVLNLSEFRSSEKFIQAKDKAIEQAINNLTINTLI